MDLNSIIIISGAISALFSSIVALIDFRIRRKYQHSLDKKMKDYQANLKNNFAKYKLSLDKEMEEFKDTIKQKSQLHQEQLEIYNKFIGIVYYAKIDIEKIVTQLESKTLDKKKKESTVLQLSNYSKGITDIFSNQLKIKPDIFKEIHPIRKLLAKIVNEIEAIDESTASKIKSMNDELVELFNSSIKSMSDALKLN
ncbi:hypothetical protein AGMMS50262_21250 [Bacteroidia bacterium]|nr:hypothetical protein AGMMS50262_21250 [Bacteroidia bacterium]